MDRESDQEESSLLPHEPAEELTRPIGGVGGKPLGLKVKGASRRYARDWGTPALASKGTKLHIR